MWKFYIDRGGTFTDCVGRNPDTGCLHATKVLSSDQSPLTAIRKLLGIPKEAQIPACEVRMGTTVATNALLERRGAPTAFVTSRGFRDLLSIGTQARPDLFTLNIEKPTPLYHRAFELDVRIRADGELEHPLDVAEAQSVLSQAQQEGCTSLAVALPHALKRPEVEASIADIARALGYQHVSMSHEVSNTLGLLPRAETTLLDAYLTPLLRHYLGTIQSQIPNSELRVMQSSGDLTSVDLFRGPDALLSGPAGGVVAYAKVAESAGYKTAIGFDMGGTSSDVSRFDGSVPTVYESQVDGIRVLRPSLDIHTVAAGGGSLCTTDGSIFRVGPESAGSNPGPLCYGNPEANELTVTDVNLALGRLCTDRFPFELNRRRVNDKLLSLSRKLKAEDIHLTPDDVALGFWRVANDSMASAIREVSVARGYDVRQDALVVFGGAGGQHACALAKELDMNTVLLHPLAGVLSAYGMGFANTGAHITRSLGSLPLEQCDIAYLREVLDQLTQTAQETVCQSIGSGERRTNARQVQDSLHASATPALQGEDIGYTAELDLRYAGTNTALTVAWPHPKESSSSVQQATTDACRLALASSFEQLHERRFGYTRQAHPIEITQARVSASLRNEPSDSLQLASAQTLSPGDAPHHAQDSRRSTRVCCDGQWVDNVPIVNREALKANDVLRGPICVLEDTSTIVVDPGFTARLLPSGTIKLQRDSDASDSASKVSSSELAPTLPPKNITAQRAFGSADPVLLELISNAWMSLATQMGSVLEQTALSTNIKERLDFSCAVFTGNGDLIANAPHIPVHLGAMSESVQAVIRRHPVFAHGESFIVNSPEFGGSHLPDITVVTPVFVDKTNQLQPAYFVASRGHHADVGGISPGSMPAFSSSLEQEGILFEGERFATDGGIDEDFLRRRFLSGEYPARDVTQNLADLRAQVAANAVGSRLARELVLRFSEPALEQYTEHLFRYSEQQVRTALSGVWKGREGQTFELHDALDDGSPIGVQARFDGQNLSLNFVCAPQSNGNSNAPRAVTTAAVMYALRCVAGSGLPLNAGTTRAVSITIPPSSLLNPNNDRAVCSGNVETAQRIVDVLLGALSLAAASQGTMNNVTFGNDTFGYYETLGGGSGSTQDADGASAVQVHMTNTRITDLELLESRFPVRLRRFSIRTGSGGDGRRKGGLGLVREYEFDAQLVVNLVSERRIRAPFGIDGGESGSLGRNCLNGVELPGRCSLNVVPGDVLTIETPGGGGYGKPAR